MPENFPLTFNDILNAALIAAMILVCIRFLGWAFRVVLARTRYIPFDPQRVQEVRSRCSNLFPVEKLTFEGTTFSRGAILRIITNRQLAIEGEFVGANHSNMLCLVTHESVIAQELHSIESIQIIGQARNA